MAQFTFPISEVAFRNALKGQEKVFEALLPGETDPIGQAYSCIRMGWMNKQHHKAKQQRDKEMDLRIKEALAKNPKLAEQLGIQDKKRGL